VGCIQPVKPVLSNRLSVNSVSFGMVFSSWWQGCGQPRGPSRVEAVEPDD
jgi:hypothetical protein